MTLPEGLLVAWYGDDFTGSAAVMEVLTFAGLPSVLFLEVPTPAQLARFAGVRGIGIASTARAHGVAWMDAELPAAFATLAGLGAPVAHYKMCSTLNSSPETGSVGRAIDLALPVIPSAWTPVLVAAPPMRRYQAFGTLFAAGPGGVSRLDRHPVMARHPVTPMDEADVARHLARQTDRAIGLVTLEDLASPEAAEAARAANLAAGAGVMALDCIDGPSLAACGRLIWEARGRPQFAVGSQGVEYALVRYWQEAGLIPEAPAAGGIGPAGRMAVVSGSVSPVTAAQIDWSLAHGLRGDRLRRAGGGRAGRARGGRGGGGGGGAGGGRARARSRWSLPRAGRTTRRCRRSGRRWRRRAWRRKRPTCGSARRSGGCSTR